VPASEHQSVLRIAAITGKIVRGMPVPAGRTGERVSVTWDTRDEHGQLVPNGVYFVRVAQAQAVCKVIVQRQ
jgi:flagellar hook assembly protein FlgD